MALSLGLILMCIEHQSIEKTRRVNMDNDMIVDLIESCKTPFYYFDEMCIRDRRTERMNLQMARYRGRTREKDRKT